MKKLNVIALAVSSALFAGSVMAESDIVLDIEEGDQAAPAVVEQSQPGTDVLTDGWQVNGYASMNYRMVDGHSVDTEFGKPDYKTAGTHGKSTNQVEFVVKKHTEHVNGIWSDFVVRTEYGNGNSYNYSSPGSQKDNTTAQFEVKESFVEIGGFGANNDISVWGGMRYLNRAAGLLSGEFWKQSSGVGAGVQTKLAGNTAGFAVVSADTDGDINNGAASKDRQTLTSFDLYYYGVDVGIGSMDFDLKYITQANSGDNENGIGASITLNSSYYGLDGWTQTAIAYGNGNAQNRGVNFGSWSGGDDNAESLFLTSYGVLNIAENWQMGSEVTYFMALDELFTAKDLERLLVAVRPTYRINDNFRVEATASYAYENGADGYWGRSGDDLESNIFNIELAGVISVNADYFGRPQIKPYVSYILADDEASAKQIGIDSGKDEVVVGIHTEIWF